MLCMTKINVIDACSVLYTIRGFCCCSPRLRLSTYARGSAGRPQIRATPPNIYYCNGNKVSLTKSVPDWNIYMYICMYVCIYVLYIMGGPYEGTKKFLIKLINSKMQYLASAICKVACNFIKWILLRKNRKRYNINLQNVVECKFKVVEILKYK